MKNKHGLEMVIVGKFSGQNKGIALRLYNVLIAVPEMKARGLLVCHKISADYMSDIGNACANAQDEEIKTKVGKTNKDGASNHSFRMVARDIKTPAGTIAQIVSQIDEMHSNQCILKRFLPPFECLPDGVRNYITDCEKFCMDQVECTLAEFEEAKKESAKKSEKTPA